MSKLLGSILIIFLLTGCSKNCIVCGEHGTQEVKLVWPKSRTYYFCERHKDPDTVSKAVREKLNRERENE